jgi:acyl-CoA hydrolase
MPRLIRHGEIAAVLPPGGMTLVSSCSAESALLYGEIMSAGDALGDMQFSGVMVGGLNRRNWLPNRTSRFTTFFQTPELRSVADQVEFLPLCYQDGLAELRRRSPKAVLAMVSPPDEKGNCSFGCEHSFLASLWHLAPVRIAHINPAMPRTHGDPGIPYEEITAFFEGEQRLLGMEAGDPDPVSNSIANHVAAYVDDGVTIQTGLGKVPDAMMRVLGDRRQLRIHSGLVGDGVLDLIDAGAISGTGAIVAGCAIGSAQLYDRIADPVFAFQPASYTHGRRELAAIDRLVTINSAIEVDLFGQAYAELTPKGLMSGPGGASDFARGARSGRGVRNIVLPSAAAGGSISRIVAPGNGAGPVSLGRMDIDIVVTEHGAADLRAKSHAARAEALIAIAAPDHRTALAEAWASYSTKL